MAIQGAPPRTFEHPVQRINRQIHSAIVAYNPFFRLRSPPLAFPRLSLAAEYS